MSGVGKGFLIMLCINVVLFFFQVAVNDINPGGAPTVLNYGGSPISQFDAGGYELSQNTTALLPGAASSVSPTTGNIFTDTYTTLKSWITGNPIVNFLAGFFLAVPDFLKSIGLPLEIRYGISALWYGFGVLLLISYSFGRDD